MALFLQSTKVSIWARFIVLLIGLTIIASETRAQGILHFNRLKGELVFEFRLFRSKADGFPSTQEYITGESLRIGSSGYVLHPGIMTFNVDVSPTF